MKIHIADQTADVEAGAILIRFDILEDEPTAPVEAPEEVAPEAPVEAEQAEAEVPAEAVA